MTKSVQRSLGEYGRGVAGGLLFSLPLLYTMEIWWTGFTAGPIQLLALLVVTYALLIGYNWYGGFREDYNIIEILFDALEEIGIGLLVAALVLWLIGRISADMGVLDVVGKIVLEASVVAIGISIGKAQLHGESDNEDESEAPQGNEEPTLLGEVVISLCGAIVFAANVAPTEEIVMIALETSPWKVLGLAMASMGVGTVVLYYANFLGAKRGVRRPESIGDVIAGVVVMYGVALATSAFMLWFFGRFGQLSLPMMAAEIVVLGVAATLGASAGRLLIRG